MTFVCTIDERQTNMHVNEKLMFRLYVYVGNQTFTSQRHVYQVNSHRRLVLSTMNKSPMTHRGSIARARGLVALFVPSIGENRRKSCAQRGDCERREKLRKTGGWMIRRYARSFSDFKCQKPRQKHRSKREFSLLSYCLLNSIYSSFCILIDSTTRVSLLP